MLTGNFYFNTPQAYMYYFDGRIHRLVRSLLTLFPCRRQRGIDVILVWVTSTIRINVSTSLPAR
ncbi:MAG: hypothetical protein ACLU38_09065 [Dysosmobacter sp.]